MTGGLSPASPQKAVKSVSILGSTGSIGVSTLDLIAGHPDAFRVEALTAHRNVALLAEQARASGAALAVIADESLYQDLKSALSGTGIEVAAGAGAVEAAAARPADVCMSSIVGAAGMRPTLAAIAQGRTVALANKESLVCAGSFMMEAVAESGATLLPVDSEHNAIFQVFDNEQRAAIRRVILTASGGPFLRKSRAELADVTPAEAVRHPNWSMGAKISVDSATMMNKSLEIIEAAHLFDLKSEEIDVLIHPQSVVHSMVEYVDGSILAQMGAPDMRTPIAYALAWPERIATTGDRLDLTKQMSLSFEPPDTNRFKSLKLVRQVLTQGQGAAIAFNAANEIAVEAFLAGQIRFLEIEDLVDHVLQKLENAPISTLDDVFAADAAARRLAQAYVGA